MCGDCLERFLIAEEEEGRAHLLQCPCCPRTVLAARYGHAALSGVLGPGGLSIRRWVTFARRTSTPSMSCVVGRHGQTRWGASFYRTPAFSEDFRCFSCRSLFLSLLSNKTRVLRLPDVCLALALIDKCRAFSSCLSFSSVRMPSANVA